MKAEIINIGDELLIGQVVNTNAAWMAEQLTLAGILTERITVIGDTREEILGSLAEAEKRAEIVLISGGIGPTNDDRTKVTLCEFFHDRLVFSEDAYRDIEQLFHRRGYPVTELNRQQAELPEHCTPIPNPLGTARGMWFEKPRPGGGITVFVSMPGVPFEMKEMMTSRVIPDLRKVFSPPVVCNRTLLTQGIGESFLAARIADWENALPPDIRLAYLPQPGIVRLRLTATGTEENLLRERIEREVAQVSALIPEYLFGFDDDTLEAIIGWQLSTLGATLATAESCTGGALAAQITQVPGSSAYFLGSVVAYANEVKSRLLGVDPAIIARHGAVSGEVVSAMAEGVRLRLGSDYALATSGVAGPSGGTPEKPVGTSWIAVASRQGVTAHHFLFGDNRERNIRRTVLAALNLLRKVI